MTEDCKHSRTEPIEQDIDKWKRELREAGWRQYRYRGHDYKTMWVSPSGSIHRGPYGAWRMMKSLEQWNGTHEIK